jgi:hypothetical protein
LSRERVWLDFEAFRNLYVSQLDCLRRRGVARSYKRTAGSVAELEGLLRARRAWSDEDEWDDEANRPKVAAGTHGAGR